MRIRFLETCPSANPERPFQPGQVIDIEHPSAELLACVDGVRAVALPTDDSERAVEPDAEQPEPVRVKGRKRE
jgi:hypothetical protein